MKVVLCPTVGGSRFFGNVATHVPNRTELNPKRPYRVTHRLENFRSHGEIREKYAHRIGHILPDWTYFTRVDIFYQIGHILPDWTYFTRLDIYYQIGHILPDWTYFTRVDIFYQIGHILPEWTYFTRLDIFYQIGHILPDKYKY
jgi:hypothetical protein